MKPKHQMPRDEHVNLVLHFPSTSLAILKPITWGVLKAADGGQVEAQAALLLHTGHLPTAPRGPNDGTPLKNANCTSHKLVCNPIQLYIYIYTYRVVGKLLVAPTGSLLRRESGYCSPSS